MVDVRDQKKESASFLIAFAIFWYPVFRNSSILGGGQYLVYLQTFAVVFWYVRFVFKEIIDSGIISKETMYALLSQGVFYFYSLVILAIWYLSSSEGEGQVSILSNQLRYIITCIPWVYSAVELSRYEIKIWHHMAALLSVLLNLNDGLYVDSTALDGNESISYQSWGDLFAIIALLSFGAKKAFKRVAIGLFYLLILFAIPSRSSLLFYIATLSVYLLYLGWLRARVIAVSIISASIISFYFFGDDFTTLLEAILGDSRHITMIDLDRSDSNYMRYITIIYGLEAFAASPLFGDFAFQIKYLSNPGLYMHNFFDIFVQYGIFGFLLFALALFFVYKDLIKKDFVVGAKESLALVFVFCIFSFLFARNYAATYLFVGVGLFFLLMKKPVCDN